MAKSISWSYAPYKPYFYKSDIYISRVVPDVNSVSFEWLSAGSSEYSIYYKKRDEEVFLFAGKTALTEYKIDGLDTDVDYEFYVESDAGKSLVRLAHTGAAVGTVINYLHPDDQAYSYSGNYLCTPFLLRHPDGYLLDADSWAFTEPLLYSSEWEGTVKGCTTGCIEGSVVLAPDGRLLNIMRYDTEKAEPNYGIILAFEIDTENPSASLKYSHAINFPVNLSKFIIKKDEVSGYYYTLATRITNPDFVDARNLLSLMRSKDLDNWEVCADILDGRNWEDAEKIGFQYVSFEIEGDDIIFQCRTAVNRPYSYHNTNYSTFHRIKNFRDLKG